ncbi:MAG: 50S ribosomal protein L32 [Patescibacteria group bacterium]
MTPLPKKKHAKARTRTRKAAISFSVPNLVTCPKCGNLKFPHMVCPSCGHYK